MELVKTNDWLSVDETKYAKYYDFVWINLRWRESTKTWVVECEALTHAFMDLHSIPKECPEQAKREAINYIRNYMLSRVEDYHLISDMILRDIKSMDGENNVD